MTRIAVPVGFAADTVEREGAAGVAWVTAVPDVVAEHLERWSLHQDGAVMHGYVAVVVPVRGADGERLVLKASWLDEDSRAEPVSLAAWDGAGAVRLLAADVDNRQPPTSVMLLERLDPARSLETALPPDEATATIGVLVRRLSETTAPDGVRPLADLAVRWAEELPADWRRLGRPLPARLVDAAVATCRELGPVAGDRLLHADMHYDNVLGGTREHWLAIDPQGLAGDPAAEALPVLRGRWDELVAAGPLEAALARRLDIWCEAAEVDRAVACRWAQARTVEAVLRALDRGLTDKLDVTVPLASALT